MRPYLPSMNHRAWVSHGVASVMSTSCRWPEIAIILPVTVDAHVVCESEYPVGIVYSESLSAVQILQQRLTSTVLLIKAMGGGWDPENPMQTPAGEMPATMPTTQP